MANHKLKLLFPLAVVALAACATPKPATESAGAPAQGEGDEKFQKFLHQCRDSYADVDARIAKAGVHDATYYQVPGFPYVRTDRLMSSYRGEVSGDINTLGTWMLQLRENDSIARDIELANMGMPKYERADLLNSLRTCAVWLTFAELADPPTLARLIDAVQIPEPPAPAEQKTVVQELSARRAKILAEFSGPLPRPSVPLTNWQVKQPPPDPNLPHGFSQVARDELGRIGLLMNQWPELAAQNAPQLLIETGGDYDRLGTPILTAGGPSVDTSKPVVYYLPSYARVGSRTLVQINYIFWFSARPPGREGDLEAGALDGRIWRVTLGDDGKALAYDTIRASGFDHLWFPDRSLAPRADVADAEPPLVPQTQIPQGGVALRLQSATHDLRRLIRSKDTQVAETRRYELRPYEDLMTLPAPSGGTRSLFDPSGVVPGSERPANPLYRAAGVAQAGAMRQWGNHETALLGRRYFDDPRLIEELFVMSPPATEHARLP